MAGAADWLMVLALQAAALVAVLVATSAIAADAARDRLLLGKLSIAGVAGHDCGSKSPPDPSVDLFLDAPTEGFALVGFEDGHIVRWTYANGMLASAQNTPAMPLQRALSSEGAAMEMIAPGTETCRWTGTLRLQDSRAAGGDKRKASLVARDAANAVFAEGDDLYAKGKAAEAVPVYERATAMRRDALGDDHPLTLRAESRVAAALHRAGNSDEGRARLERVLSVQQRMLGEDALDTMRTRASIGILYWGSGQPREGLPFLERAFQQLKDGFGPTHLETLSAQSNLGLTLYELGRLQDALRHYERVLPAFVAIRGDAHPRTLDAMNNLALVYNDLGRNASAIELLERAYWLSVSAMGAEHPDSLSMLLPLGDAYSNMDRTDDALEIYRTAHSGLRRTLGDDHLWTISAQSGIAQGLAMLQRSDEALPIIAGLAPRAERVLGLDHILSQRLISLRGAVHAGIGDHAAALADLQRAYELQVASFGAEHPDALGSLSSIGREQLAAGQPAAAKETLQRVLDDLRRVSGPGHRNTLETEVSLAEASVALGEKSTAIGLLNGVVATVESLRANEGLSRETRQAFFSRWSSGYKLLALLYGLNDPLEAFRIAELSKARGLLESLALRTADMAGVLEPEDIARLAALEETASAMSHTMAHAATTTDEKVRLESERNSIVRQTAAFRRDLKSRYPRYAELAEVALIDAERASTLARPGEALISYLVAGEDAIAFVVRRGRPLAVVPLGRIAGLDRTLEAYRTLLVGSLDGDRLPVWRRRDGSFIASLSRPDDALARVQDAQVVGRALAARLIAPLEPALAGTKRWIISPDAALATLPFEALPRKGRPLVTHTTVSYVQSLSVLALMQSRPGLASAEHSLLAMGAPRFDRAAIPGKAVEPARALRSARGPVADELSRGEGEGRLRWSELPGAEREIEAVAALFPVDRRVVAVRDAASEEHLRSLNASGQLAGFRYLLFATHAYLDTVVPARSALVLSQVDLAPGTDGYVTVAKWPAYRLQSELAVLSACETGLGRQVQGEGVMGLPYALFVAGNRATVLTLWRVDDAATAMFVTDLFRRLRGGVDAATALAATKRRFIAGPLRNRAPAVWAPFVHYGR